MQYMMLIYSDSRTHPAPDTPEFNQMLADYSRFGEEASSAGVFVAGDALQPVTTATTVRSRHGKAETTDGPFAETKETLGGYYLLDCKDLDEAISYAAKIPTAKFGSIEIRPVMTFD